VKITRLYSGSDGKSHLEDIEIPAEETDFGWLRTKLKVSEVYIMEGNPKGITQWHTCPQRQYILTLSGMFEVKVADGSKCCLGPGQILLAEDITGHGHITRAINHMCLIMPLE
jgi:quercetin dioxygenase-like cupin family protein